MSTTKEYLFVVAIAVVAGCLVGEWSIPAPRKRATPTLKPVSSSPAYTVSMEDYLAKKRIRESEELRVLLLKKALRGEIPAVIQF